MKKEKTYILKYPVYNHVDFPAGTVVKLIDHEFYKFEAVKGKLAGEKGDIADGMDGYLLHNTPENKAAFNHYSETIKKLENEIGLVKKAWHSIKTVKL